jgi:hypothetical protein
MKKIVLLSTIIITSISLFSCGEKSKSDTKTNAIDNTARDDSPNNEVEINYTKTESCEAFIASIDFSSFCFTSKETTKYRLIQNSETNCQYQLYNDKSYQNIDFSIAFANFNKLFGKEPQPELAKNIFLTVYKKNKRTRMIPSGSKEIKNLGDDAYIGFNQSEDHKEQYLGVRVGNVVFTFVFQHGENLSSQSCMEAEEDLIKIGKLVVDAITKN